MIQYSSFGRAVLALVIVAVVVFLRRPRKTIFVYPLATSRGVLFFVNSLVRVTVLLLLVLYSFDIRRTEAAVPQQLPSRQIAILLDGSLSMSAGDVKPNRFSHAKSIISDIVAQITGTSYSLVVFSGLPVVRIPWSNDTLGIQQVLSGMKLAEFPPTNTFLGTALGDALLLSLDQFSRLPLVGNRAIILISDGDSNKGYDPYKTLSILQQQRIPVYFIALGVQGYEIGKDSVGLPVTTNFDTQLMQQFTSQTDGKVYLNPSDKNIQELISTIKSKNSTEERVVYLTHEKFLNKIILPWFAVSLVYLLVTCIAKIWLRKNDN